MSVTIVPTVFAKTKEGFYNRFERVIPLAEDIQIDFMDGEFLPVSGVMPDIVPDLQEYKKKFEAHLMIAHPEDWVERVAQKGFARFLFHIESQDDVQQTRDLIERIKGNHMLPGIVLNPRTQLDRVEPFLADISLVMFMGHEPGMENVGIEPGVLQKIRYVKQQHPELEIEVDGGVDNKSAPRFVAAGATRLSVGSYIANSKDPAKALAELQELVKR